MTNIDYKQPTESFLKGIDVHELLPQQEPFVMINKLIHFDEKKTVTQTNISPDNIFVDNDVFSAAGLIENVAQTCASRIGYYNKYILQKGIQLGFIGAIRNFEVHELPKIGETITTSVDVLEEVFGMTLAKAQIMSGDKLLATTEMKIAIKSESNE